MTTTCEHNLIQMLIETVFGQPYDHVRMRQLAAGGTEHALMAFGSRLLTQDLPRLARGDVGAVQVPLRIPIRVPQFEKTG